MNTFLDEGGLQLGGGTIVGGDSMAHLSSGLLPACCLENVKEQHDCDNDPIGTESTEILNSEETPNFSYDRYIWASQGPTAQ